MNLHDSKWLFVNLYELVWFCFKLFHLFRIYLIYYMNLCEAICLYVPIKALRMKISYSQPCIFALPGYVSHPLGFLCQSTCLLHIMRLQSGNFGVLIGLAKKQGCKNLYEWIWMKISSYEFVWIKMSLREFTWINIFSFTCTWVYTT
jgi:hypothetical protein